MYRYAEIDGCGFIIWLRTFQEPVEAENMIPISWDFDPDGKRWNGAGWEAYETDKPEMPWENIERMLATDIRETEKRAATLGKAGAAAMQLAANAGADVARSVAVFTAHYPAWIADGGTEELNHISEYNGTTYICINPIQRAAHWTPDKAMNNYCPYPTADGEGIYPYVPGMLVWGGMKVRGGDGEIYRCTLAEGTYKLVNEPKDATSIFEIDLPFS